MGSGIWMDKSQAELAVESGRKMMVCWLMWLWTPETAAVVAAVRDRISAVCLMRNSAHVQLLMNAVVDWVAKEIGKDGTSVPTSVPATSVPATSVPATSVPATSVPATSVPATSVPATSATTSTGSTEGALNTSVPAPVSSSGQNKKKTKVDAGAGAFSASDESEDGSDGSSNES
eukprot:s7517_g1.t1